MNGALLGFSHDDMDKMYDEIVDFSELRKFMDQKLKNYSSGMQVRLAFSIAIRADTPILLLDEVLAVGDAAFKAKCDEYFDKVKNDPNQTVVLVTHDMAAVEKYCSRAILISDGKIELSGEPSEISNQYTLENFEEKPQKDNDTKNLSHHIKELDIRRRSPLTASNDNILDLDIGYELKEDIDVYLGISVKYNGISVLEHNSLSIDIGGKKDKRYKVSYKLPLASFNTSDLIVDVAIFDKANKQLLGYKTNSVLFKVKAEKEFTGGVILSNGNWIAE
jgi:ABC-2 type transport system ATP-binding protein